MRDSLELLHKHFKDDLYFRSMRHIKILDPGMDIRCLNIEEVWGDSAIHPPAHPLYSRVAASGIKLAENMGQGTGRQAQKSGQYRWDGTLAAITISMAAVNPNPGRIGDSRTATEPATAGGEGETEAAIQAEEEGGRRQGRHVRLLAQLRTPPRKLSIQ
jgi:hypothetical protein